MRRKCSNRSLLGREYRRIGVKSAAEVKYITRLSSPLPLPEHERKRGHVVLLLQYCEHNVGISGLTNGSRRAVTMERQVNLGPGKVCS